MKNTRLFIFAGYDKFQRVDATLLYYLDNLSKFGHIVFTMDNDLPDTELAKIKNVPNVLYASAKRHGEYDFGSYKRGYIWARDNNKLDKYDWIYLVNDSVFGPLTDLTKTLSIIEGMNSDFTGMVCCSTPDLPRHIQSWFVGLRKNVATSDVFNNFITSIQPQAVKSIVVYKYEIRMTQILSAAGYKYDAIYYDTDVSVYKRAAHAIAAGVPFIKKLSFSENDKIQYLYPFLSPELTDMIISYANRYGIHLCPDRDVWKMPYKKVFRITIFGLPLISVHRQVFQTNRAYKVYLCDAIPILKILFNKLWKI